MWKPNRFLGNVADELRKLGFPENIRGRFVAKLRSPKQIIVSHASVN